MDLILGQSAPIIGLMVVGFLLRQGQIIHPGDGHVMARLIINTTLPALIFVSLARADIEPASLIILALCGAAIPLILHRLAMLLARIMQLKRGIAGVMVISTMATNIGFFLFPFFLAFYGKAGISQLAAFDVGNSLVANSYAYYMATCYGDRPICGLGTSLKRVLALPTLWANIFGVAVNLTGFSLPALAVQVLEPLAAANTPLAMLALGSFIELRFSNWKPMLVTVGLRIGAGWLLGQALVLVFGLTGLARMAVSLGAAMPIGAIVLVYASMERLDVDFAATTISLSILVALLVTPLLLSIH
jgi:predicted permease